MTTEMFDLPPAAEMRAKIEEGQNTAARAQLQELRQAIIHATNAGRCSISVNKFTPGVQRLLDGAGYKVTYYPGDQRDQRDFAHYTVSW